MNTLTELLQPVENDLDDILDDVDDVDTVLDGILHNVEYVKLGVKLDDVLDDAPADVHQNVEDVECVLIEVDVALVLVDGIDIVIIGRLDVVHIDMLVI